MRQSTVSAAPQACAVPRTGTGPHRAWRLLTGGHPYLATAAAAAAALVAVNMSAGAAGTSPGAFDIRRISQDTVAVHIIDTSAETDVMTGQLHEAGLNITVMATPASPQLVGTWLSASFSDDVPEPVVQLVLAQVPNGYTTSVDLPARFEGDIALTVGRAPRGGEVPRATGPRNALAPGGRLRCLHASGGEPDQVREDVEGLGYTVTWADGDAAELLPAARPGTAQKVTSAYVDDAHPSRVELVATTPGSRRYETLIGHGFSPTQWRNRESTPGPCTRPQR